MNTHGKLANITNCNRLSSRINKEWKILETQAPFGVRCTAKNEKINEIAVEMMGGKGTPYEDGVFQLEIQISDRYPMVPPSIHFVTPIYHPNIDDKGRICLDILKMPPEGAWKPSIQLHSVLSALQELLVEPNPDDPLMVQIAQEYKYQRDIFQQKAREWTKKYALPKASMMAGLGGGKAGHSSNTSAKPGVSSATTDDHSDSDSSDSSESENDQPPATKKSRT